MGFSTDVFTAPGHPGFPQDSDLVENNNFYDNNFNTFLPACAAGQKPGPPSPGQSADNPGGNCSDVEPTVPVPVGVGLWIAGGNANVIRNNRFWNNWRRGTMLFAVPDIFVCNDPNNQVAGCNPVAVPLPPDPPATHEASATSYRNQFYGNKMGVAPDGTVQPNGSDFWWDQGGLIVDPSFNSGNCWFNNTGTDGTGASVTSEQGTLPSDCSNSPLPGGPTQANELLGCNLGDPSCTWFETPPKP
jgi:hypothetical protein